MSHMFAFIAGVLATSYLQPAIEAEWRALTVPGFLAACAASIVLHYYGM